MHAARGRTCKDYPEGLGFAQSSTALIVTSSMSARRTDARRQSAILTGELPSRIPSQRERGCRVPLGVIIALTLLVQHTREHERRS